METRTMKFHKNVKMGYVTWILWLFVAKFLVVVQSAGDNGGMAENDVIATKVDNITNAIYKHFDEVQRSKDVIFIEASTPEPRMKMFMNELRVILFNYTLMCDNLTSVYKFKVTSDSPKVLRISETSLLISCANAIRNVDNSTSQVQILTVDGIFDVKLMSGLIGFDELTYHLAKESDGENKTVTEEKKFYDVIVIRKMRPVDRIFRIAVYCVQIFTLIGFGSKLDLKVVKECLRRPIAPGIGFCCQYLMMPLIAAAIGKSVTDEATVSLGIFVAGCCPGGGQSNMYSYLLKGDLSLSITMTTISTIAALAMLPAWIYSLGRVFIVDKNLVIPFSNVAIALAILIVPLCFGVFLKTKFPECAKKLQKALKPVILIFAIILLVVGIYSNLYIFSLFRPRVVLAGCLLPYIGYIVGGTVAALLKQPWPRVKTIALETGMQNTSIAYILLVTSFEAPTGDLASVASIASAVMTPLPPLLITIVYLIYQKCKQKYEPVSQDGEEMVKNKELKDKKTDEVDGNVKEPKAGEKDVAEKLTAV